MYDYFLSHFSTRVLPQTPFMYNIKFAKTVTMILSSLCEYTRINFTSNQILHCRQKYCNINSTEKLVYRCFGQTTSTQINNLNLKNMVPTKRLFRYFCRFSILPRFHVEYFKTVLQLKQFLFFVFI